MIFILKIFCTLSVSFALTEADTGPAECRMWESAASIVSDQEFVNMTCASNVLCTGFSCYGTSLFEVARYSVRDPFGFAVELSPCSDPLILHFHLNSSDLKFTKLMKLYGRNEETIALVTSDVGGEEVSFGRLSVAWNVIRKPEKLVALEVNFTRVFPRGDFLPIPLVPLQNYSVPNCQNGTDAPVAVEAPESVGCEGSECYSRFQNPIRGLATRSFYSGMMLRVGIGALALVVVICVFAGFVFIRRRRFQSRKLLKLTVDNDAKGESEEEDLEEEDSVPSSRDSPDDQRRSLLKL